MLQERARADPKLEIRCGEKLVAIVGNGGVTGVLVENSATGKRERLAVYGVLVHVGYEPTTACLEGVLALDDSGYILVNDRFETDVPGTFAAGDIRSGAPRQVAAAVEDGKAAATGALEFLESLKQHG